MVYKVRIGAERDPFTATLQDAGVGVDLTGYTDAKIDFWSNGQIVLTVNDGDAGITVTTGVTTEQVEHKWQAGQTELFAASERAYAIIWIEDADGWKAYPEEGAVEFRVTKDGP